MKLNVFDQLARKSRLALCRAWMTLSLLVFWPFSSFTRRSNALSLASRSMQYTQAVVNTPVDSPLHVHLLQGVVEGFYKHVDVGPCSLSCLLYTSPSPRDS